MLNRIRLSAAVLGAFLLVGSVVPSMAENCEHRVRKAEDKLHREESRHGERSRQAENARRDLEREKGNCRADNGRNRHDHYDHHDNDHR